jgi:membrane protein implicated in regulation of membrane protease activity
MELVWWHWLALGLLLIGSELLLPAFYLIWFGLGALLTGLVVALVPLGMTGQLVLWSVASTAMVAAWMKFFRNPDRTHAGQAKEGALGMVGLVTRDVGELSQEISQGEILFQRPVLGSDRWPVVADHPIPAGVKARVVDVLGQTLKIEKI